MGLEKSTYVPTSSNGRLAFKRSGNDLEIQVIDADGTMRDTALLGEDDLRSLLKDNFKATRGPKKGKAIANGKPKGKGIEATA